MGILGKIRDLLLGGAGAAPHDPTGIYLYAKCARCGTPLRIRVDKHNDLQRDYDTGEFHLHKEMMDGTCFSLMHATVRFDAAYRILEQHIEGGEFILASEYQALTQPTPAERQDDEEPSDDPPAA